MIRGMKIRKIEYKLIESQRKEPFVIATGSSNIARNIIVKIITDEGMGIGNACPNSVTGETHETIQMACKLFADKLVDEDPEDIEGINNKMDDILERNPSAKAGVDIALYDLMAKKSGQPVFEIFGKKKDKILTDMTIGIMGTKDAVEHAVHYREQGFKALKIKIGLDHVEDIKRIGMIREAVGEDVIIRVDANQGYDVKTAIEVLSKIEPFNIEQVEQPVKWDDIWGLKEVKENSTIPITADEAVKTIEDAKMIIESGCADNINIKLMKCGGLTKALEINRIASENGIPTMIGCMGENKISIAAGVHFAISQENVKYADLDSHFSFIDENIKGGFSFEVGFLVPKKVPGLGIEMVKE
jgi:o-succinylbenzoate synthase